MSRCPDLTGHTAPTAAYGFLNCIKTVLDPMIDGGWGRIVRIVLRATSGCRCAYRATARPDGIEGFIRHLAVEVGAGGVTAKMVALDMMGNVVSAQSAAMVEAIPVGRPGTPDNMGAAVAYLAWAEAS